MNILFGFLQSDVARARPRTPCKSRLRRRRTGGGTALCAQRRLTKHLTTRRASMGRRNPTTPDLPCPLHGAIRTQAQVAERLAVSTRTVQKHEARAIAKITEAMLACHEVMEWRAANWREPERTGENHASPHPESVLPSTHTQEPTQ